MKLGSIDIAVPLLVFDIEVMHSSKRALTAFERMILSLHARFKKNNNYGILPIQQIFAEILGVPNSNSFLAFTLSELIAIDVIRCQKSLSEISAIRLSDIEVTERGSALIKDNRLPSVIRKNTERVVFEPVSRRFSDPARIDLGKEAGDHGLDAAPFMGTTPLESIRDYISQQNYAWLDETSCIDSVSVTAEAVAWSNISAEVGIDGRKIDIEFQDDIYTRYVSELPSASVLERVLGKELFTGMPWGFTRSSHFSYEKNGTGSATDHFFPLGYVLNNFCENSRVWLINLQGLSWYSQLQVLPGHVVVSFRPDMPKSELSLTWNENNNGCHIEIGGVFPLEGYHLVVDGYLIQLLDTEVTIGRDVVTLPLVKAVASKEAQIILREILDQIETSVASVDDLDDKLIPIMWLAKDCLLNTYIPNSASVCTTFVGIVELLDKVRDTVKQRWNSLDAVELDNASMKVLAEFRQRGAAQDEEYLNGISELSSKYHWLKKLPS